MNTYEITILNWDEYNPQHKKSYKKFLFYNGFFSDPKISQLTPMEVIIWINLLCIRSECSQDHFTIHAKSLPKQYRLGDASLQNALQRFESFQLLTFVKIEPLINRIEVKRREEKVTEPLPADLPLERSIPKINPQVLVDLWEQQRGPFPQMQVFSDQRRRTAIAQLTKYPDLKHWIDVLEKWKKSEFCIGKWVPGFDDWMKEPKRLKTLEGGFDNRTEEVKKDTWLEAADKVLKALKEVGSYDNDSANKLTNLLGPKLFQIALKTKGGFSQMRMMKDDDYRNRKIAGLLKASYEDLKQQGVL